MKLSKGEFEHLAPTSPGRVRVNHDSELCQGDSLSLVIEHKEDGSISARCFRCGGKGWIPSPGYYRAPQVRKGEASGHQMVELDGYRLPEDVSLERSQWPTAPRLWLGKAGLQDSPRKLLWSQHKATLYIPVEQETMALGPKLAGYVLRRFDPKGYLTLAKKPESFWGLYRGPSVDIGQGTVVLVEDVLSAWKVASVTDAISLMGTELKGEVLQYLLDNHYSRAIVFLDADNPTVRMKARSIAQALSFLPEVEVLETGVDPKLYASSTLKELLKL